MEAAVAREFFDRTVVLVGELAHSLRTPLSVIQNDLNYLVSRDQSGEEYPGLARLSGIAAGLSSITQFGVSQLEFEPCEVDTLLQKLCTKSPKLVLSGDAPKAVFDVDCERLTAALRVIVDFTCTNEQVSDSVTLSCLERDGTLVLGLVGTDLGSVELETRSYDSFRAKHAGGAPFERLVWELVDLVLWAHRFRIAVSAGSSLNCELSIEAPI